MSAGLTIERGRGIIHYLERRKGQRSNRSNGFYRSDGTDRTHRGNKTDRTDGTHLERVIPAHGGYRKLKSYQTSEIIHDATVAFCARFVDRRSRTTDQMIQAARSGKQNIAEGSQASGTSRKIELKLVGIARASLEELLVDYQDFLRQRGLMLWTKEQPEAQSVRKLAYASNRSYETYRTYVEKAPADVAANTVICLIHQSNYLLDQQLRRLEERFLAEGGFSERLYSARGRRRKQ